MKKELVIPLAAACLLVAGIAHADKSNVGPMPLWVHLGQMRPAERANAEIHLNYLGALSPQNAEEQAVVAELWNRGECDKALRRMESLCGKLNASLMQLIVEMREPVSRPPSDWGPDVPISGYALVSQLTLSRSNLSGMLCCSHVEYWPSSQYYVLCNFLSTDGGAHWRERAYVVNNFEVTLAGSCAGEYYFFAQAHNGFNRMQISLYRLSVITGDLVRFANGSYSMTAGEWEVSDAVEELRMATSEDRPGFNRICFLVGALDTIDQRTGSLYCRWSDTAAMNWQSYAFTQDRQPRRGLDLTFNPVGLRSLVASWMTHEGDTASRSWRPTVGWVDDTSSTLREVAVGRASYERLPFGTGAGARGDSIQILYAHGNPGGRRWIRTSFTTDLGANWQQDDLGDSLTPCDNPDFYGRHGQGVAASYHEYGSANRVMYRHADRLAGSWAEPETASQWAPYLEEKSQVQWLEPGGYGIAYLHDGLSDWFSRSISTGIESPVAPGAEMGDPVLRSVTPNPARTVATVRFGLARPGPARIRICDISGRTVLVRALASAGPVLTVPFDVSSLAGGVYLVRLEAGAQNQSLKLAVQP